MNTTKVKLPSKPSELILLAIQDLEKAEQDPRYMVDSTMLEWHNPESGVCLVCFAGAVLAFEGILECNQNYREEYTNLTSDTNSKILALNNFRNGACAGAFEYLGLSYNKGKRFTRNITRYADNPSQFKADMRELATDLQNAKY